MCNLFRERRRLKNDLEDQWQRRAVMYSYSPGAQLPSPAYQLNDEPRRATFYNFENESNFRDTRDEEDEEEPVSALDLRIGKATESISIFDDKNVLASSNSGFGPSQPRAGQTRIATETSAPYILPQRRKPSTSDFGAIESNNLRLFRQPQNKITPRQMDRRKRFLEAALASEPSPSPPAPPTPPPQPFPTLDTIRRETILPPHLIMDSVKQYRAKMDPGVSPTRLPFWRPNPGPSNLVSTVQGQLLCNPASPYRFPEYLQSLSTDRSRTPITEYPLQRSRSPNLVTQPYHPRAYDFPQFLHPKYPPQKNFLYSFSSNQVQMPDDPRIKSEAPSTPPPPPIPHTRFLPSPPSPSGVFLPPNSIFEHDRVRSQHESYFRDRIEEGPVVGYGSSDPVEYKSSYLHHVLQRQREQTNDATEDFIRRHYPSTLTSASHDEVSEIDQRLRLIEQDSRLLESEARRSPSPLASSFERHPIMRHVSPEPESTPARLTNSVLPLNLSITTASHLDEDHHHFSVNHETSAASHHRVDLEASPVLHHSDRDTSPALHHETSQSVTPLMDLSPPSQAFRASSPASVASQTSSPPPATPAHRPHIEGNVKGKRGRPRKHAPKIPLPPLYIFIRNLLHNQYYNPRIISWVSDTHGIFKVSNTLEFARTWGRMKANRSEEMNYEKMSRAMRYHYGSPTRKGHLAMVKEKRLVYRFGELAIRWRPGEVPVKSCSVHELCKQSLCLWTKE